MLLVLLIKLGGYIKIPVKDSRIFLNGNELDYRGDNLAVKYKGNLYHTWDIKSRKNSIDCYQLLRHLFIKK